MTVTTTARAARAWMLYRNHGLVALLREVASRVGESAAARYRERVRPRLPVVGNARWNGVLVAEHRRRLDSIVPASWKPVLSGDDPTYEEALVKGLMEHVRPGDAVVVVGGGYGVTAVVAARRAGPGGRVTCYEAAEARVDDIETALRLNDPPAPVTVVHAIVSDAISLFGDAGRASLLPPAELPPCSVLQLDCEGAEVEILRNLSHQPRCILVETHGSLGASTTLVRSILEGQGYQVRDLGIAESRYARECRENDVRVLVGTRRAGAV